MEFAVIIAASFLPAIAYEITRKFRTMTREKKFSFLLALVHTAASPTYRPFEDALIDLEDTELIPYHDSLYEQGDRINEMTKSEILDLIIATANELKSEVKQAA